MRKSKMSATRPAARQLSQCAEELLAPLLHRPLLAASAPAAGNVVIGKLEAIDAAGQPQVSWSGTNLPQAAVSLVPLSPEQLGRAVALTFPAGAATPLILGVIWDPATSLQAEVDGNPVELQVSAQQTLTLHCGKASITLTADGQILLRGTYISSHSSGTQRIKGAAVRIN